MFACADRQEENLGYLPSKMKLYSCKIYDNDVLVRSFVPCYRKLDYVAGLYDLVNGFFYENRGGGAFSFDNEVNTIASKDIRDFEYYSDILRVQIPKRIDFENLFDVSKAILTGCYIDENGAIVASSSIAYADIPLEAGEYTICLEKSNDFSVYLYSGQTNDGSALVGSLKPNENEVSFTHKDMPYLRLWWITEGNSISKILITKGSYTYVELDFAGIDGYNDKLIVDRENKRVSYLQAINKLVLDGKKSLGVSDINGHNEYCYSGRLYQLYENNCGLCTHLGIADTQNEENTACFAPRGSMVFFRYDEMESQEELNAFFSEQYKSGTPVTVYCVRREPVEFDLTNTQFAKDLFSLNLPYEHNGGIVLEGNLECGKISVTYLATGSEDTEELKINYVDLSGSLVKDSRTYKIRKGSKYKAHAPEIDGYIPLKDEYEGCITEEKEITFQ